MNEKTQKQKETHTTKLVFFGSSMDDFLKLLFIFPYVINAFQQLFLTLEQPHVFSFIYLRDCNWCHKALHIKQFNNSYRATYEQVQNSQKLKVFENRDHKGKNKITKYT